MHVYYKKFQIPKSVCEDQNAHYLEVDKLQAITNLKIE